MGFFSRNKTKSVLVQSDLESSVMNVPIESLKMKEYAVNVCAGYVARIFSQSTFIINDHRWSYRLNIKPNENQSGSEFWREVIFRLYKEGEALVVLTDDNSLVLADSYSENEYKLYQNTYSNVTVDDFTFNRIFKAEDVFHFRLKNERLQVFTSSIYNDYEKIIGQIFQSATMSNQLRFKVKYPQASLQNDSMMVAKNFAEKCKDSIANASIVAIPENGTLEYEELHSPDKQSLSISPIDEAMWSFVDKVAVMIGIPAVLLHGDIAGVKEAKQLFYTNCLEPLNQLIEDEINSKIFKESSYSDSDSLNILGANKPNVFEMAESVDKLISSGAFNRNEIRQLLGYSSVDGLDEFLITKNYEKNQNDTLKGGDQENGKEIL